MDRTRPPSLNNMIPEIFEHIMSYTVMTHYRSLDDRFLLVNEGIVCLEKLMLLHNRSLRQMCMRKRVLKIVFKNTKTQSMLLQCISHNAIELFEAIRGKASKLLILKPNLLHRAIRENVPSMVKLLAHERKLKIEDDFHFRCLRNERNLYNATTDVRYCHEYDAKITLKSRVWYQSPKLFNFLNQHKPSNVDVKWYIPYYYENFGAIRYFQSVGFNHDLLALECAIIGENYSLIHMLFENNVYPDMSTLSKIYVPPNFSCTWARRQDIYLKVFKNLLSRDLITREWANYLFNHHCEFYESELQFFLSTSNNLCALLDMSFYSEAYIDHALSRGALPIVKEIYRLTHGKCSDKAKISPSVQNEWTLNRLHPSDIVTLMQVDYLPLIQHPPLSQRVLEWIELGNKYLIEMIFKFSSVKSVFDNLINDAPNGKELLQITLEIITM